MTGPFVSIIIPAKNAQATIKKCIDSIVQQSYKNYELIVVNDGSTDKTAQILADYPQIKILTTPGTGPSKARNIGIAQAKGEFVAFTDADCVVDYHWIEELLKGFINERIAGVGGIQKSPADDSCFGRKVHEFLAIFGFISDYMKQSKDLSFTNHNPTCNVMYRKSILVELDGFLVNLWPGEDVELDYRIRKRGYKLKCSPKAIVYHYRSNSLSKFCIMMYKYGWAQGVLVRRYGFFRRIHFLPFILLCFASLIIFEIIIYPDISKIIFFFLVVFFLFLIGRLFIFKEKNIILFIILFICSLASWNLGFIKGITIQNRIM